MKKIKIILLFIAALTTTAIRATDIAVAKDSIMQKLAQARTPQDSIPLIYHLMDLSASTTGDIKYSQQLIHTAHRAHNATVELDALRLFSNKLGANDSLKALCQEQALRLPPSSDRDETVLFIKASRISSRARTSSESQKRAQLQKLIAEHQKAENIYENILQLHTLCSYLAYSTTGELYIQYMEKLGELIKQLPEDGNHSMASLYYTQAAISYTSNHEYRKAIDANKKLLDIIRRLEKQYKEQGRIYRNYDTSYYNCYRRMLNNYPALSASEIEDYYQKILQIAQRNGVARRDFKTGKRPLIYYSMATGQYAQALEALKETYEKEKKMGFQMQYLQYMMEAAKAVGDNKTLLQATTEYSTLLEEYNTAKAAEKYKELQILYDVNELRTQNAQLEMEKQQAKIRWTRATLHIALGASIVMLCLLLVMLHLYHNSRKLAHRLQHSKMKLQEEQKTLLHTQKDLVVARDQAESANRMKTLFIQNMSHEIRTPLNAIVGFSQLMADSVQTGEQEDMGLYAEMISNNSELLLTLVGDVLDIAKMESGEIQPNLQPQSVYAICNLAINSVQHRTKPGVEMRFEPGTDTDITLLTDAIRLEQVLINILTNAAKFTHEGEIVLSYQTDYTNSLITFSVTDTGIGIPPEKAEIIFQRFEKLDTFSQGNGLGLHICRLIAQMLKGKVKVDTSYTKGARFLLIHPLH